MHSPKNITPIRIFAFVTFALLLFTSPAFSAAVTLNAADAFGTTSFNAAGNWSNSAAPSSGNTYTAAYTLRTPAAASSYTFAGSSLTLNSGGLLCFKGTGTSATITVGSLTLNGGNISHAQTATNAFSLAGSMNITATGGTLSPSNGNITVQSTVTGSGPLTINSAAAYGAIFTNGSNTFTGNISVQGTSSLTLSSTGNLKFAIGANGVNNSISGTGSQAATFDGTFTFDLSGAATSPGSSWTIVNVATLAETYGTNFSVAGFTDNGNGTWTSSNGIYKFTEATGVLAVAIVPPPGTGWSLTFQKEFTTLPSICQTVGSATPGWLPTDHWNNHIWTNTNCYNCFPGIDTGYMPFSTVAGDGTNVLNIKADNNAGKVPGTTKPYVTGMLSTATGANYPQNLRSSTPFNQTYGYFECRAKLPTAVGTTKGMWPAFWLMPSSGSSSAEYDIFEVLGNAPKKIYQSSHWSDYAGNQTLTCDGPDTSAGFHTYGFQWDATNIRWFIDGEMCNLSTNRYNAPMYVILNLSVGGSWPGEPDANTVLPNSMQVTYLRVYSGGTLPTYTETIKDNTDMTGITMNGTWTASTTPTGYQGSNYLHDGNTNKVTGQALRWRPCLPATASYQVYARWTADPNRCTSVPYEVNYSGGTTVVNVNQTTNGGAWVLLGTWNFDAGNAGSVRINTIGTTGYVVADAVRFVKL